MPKSFYEIDSFLAHKIGNYSGIIVILKWFFVIFTLDSTPSGNPFEGERLSTDDLFVLTSLDQLLFTLIMLFKRATLMRRSMVLRLPFYLVLPDYTNTVGQKESVM